MRIALCYPGCHRRGGIERVLLECANFLSNRGHEVHVFSAAWDHDALDSDVIRHNVPMLLNFSFGAVVEYAIKSRRMLSRLTPPVDVVGMFGVQCPPGDVLWVPSVHRAWLEISRGSRNWIGRLKQLLNPFHAVILAYERSCFDSHNHKKLLALTNAVQADVGKYYDVPQDNISILPNGFSETEFNVSGRSSRRNAMRARLGYNDSDRVVVFVANEMARKGFVPLLRAIALLKDPRVKVLAVGRLKPTAAANEVERLEMSARVHFTGSTSDVAAFYAAGDVFALPTEYEAWGLVIVEAMACGLPALTSRLAGAAIVIQEDLTGQLLDDPRSPDEIAAKLRPLLKGENLSAEEISASVQGYRWSEILARYEEVLFACAAQKSSRKGLLPMSAAAR